MAGLVLGCRMPQCEKTNDLSDGEHDMDSDIAISIFSNKWDELKGHIVTCEHCKYEFEIESVEF